ncbi:MAG: bifunctional UDP-sugar hydrolase/5'-nucleotidase [Pseudomonadales bacterium]
MTRSIFTSALLALLLFPISSTAEVLELVVIHTNDFHGHIKEEKDYAGAARIGAFVKLKREQHPGVLFLDAGDAVSGTPVSTMFQGTPIFHIMNAMTYDVGLIGNHEFDHGFRHIKKFKEIANHPLLGANVFDSMNRLISDGENRLLEVNGISVGIIGLLTETTPTIISPRGNEGLIFLDPATVLREQIKLVRPMVDIVIVLSHVGHEKEKQLARDIQGIDLIVGAHSHTLVDPIVKIGTTYITQANRYGSHVGFIKLQVDTESNSISSMEGGHPIPAKELPPPDRQILSLVNYWEEKVEAVVDVEIANSTREISAAELQGIFEDILATETDADFGYYNIGGIRDKISKGPITARHFWNIEPFENKLVTLKITGADYLTLLARENEQHSSIGAIDPGRKYKIATNSFIGAHAAKTFGDKVIVNDLGILVRDVLIDHVRANGI